MLIKCPECELQVSDKAIACPHCGCPIDVEATKRIKRKKNNKRRRLPNGFGQITKVNGKYLRKPYRARVTIGKNEYGKPIVKDLKPICFFETYNDAYEALVEYNKNPYDLDGSTMTIKELYEKWTDYYFETLESDASKRTIRSAWNYCSSVYDMRVVDLRARHIRGCMEEGTYEVKGQIKNASAGTKGRIKSLFNMMLDYAMEYEIVTINYARTFDVSTSILEEQAETKRDHIPYTDKEMKLLWDNLYKVDYVNVVLFQCYSGWRPQELGLIRLENVDLDKGIMIGGMKTKAGKDRPVPIHPKIYDITKHMYEQAKEIGSEYLINCVDVKTHRGSTMMTYDKLRHRYDKIVATLQLNINHRPHDARKHFVTMAKRCDMDEYALKHIIGHEISDITEKVYTERNIDWLKAEMQKIK